MNKKAKIIIGILSCIIVVLLLVIILLLNNKKSGTETTTEKQEQENNKIVGLYHSTNYDKQEATIQFNKDHTCKYPHSKDICEWTLSDDKITITLTNYNIVVDTESNNSIGIATIYYTLESCNKDIEQLSDEFINPRCEAQTFKREATLLNDSILLNETRFYKIN